MESQLKAWGIGGLIALIVLVLAIILIVLGRLDILILTGGFIAALAVARLL